MFAGSCGVGVKSNMVSVFGDRDDFLCLTWPLMGDPYIYYSLFSWVALRPLDRQLYVIGEKGNE